MQRVKNCNYFTTFGRDLKEARIAMNLTRAQLAEIVGIEPRYLANIENSDNIPSLPIFCDLVRACRMPVDPYFFPEKEKNFNSQQIRLHHKLDLCPEPFISNIEAILDEIIKIEEKSAQ